MGKKEQLAAAKAEREAKELKNNLLDAVVYMIDEKVGVKTALQKFPIEKYPGVTQGRLQYAFDKSKSDAARAKKCLPKQDQYASQRLLTNVEEKDLVDDLPVLPRDFDAADLPGEYHPRGYETKSTRYTQVINYYIFLGWFDADIHAPRPRRGL